MKYFIDYQQMPKGAQRPLDSGEIVGIEASDDSGVVVLPNVGDFVLIDNSADGGERASFSGKVRSGCGRRCGTTPESPVGGLAEPRCRSA